MGDKKQLKLSEAENIGVNNNENAEVATCSAISKDNNNQYRPQDLQFPKKKLLEGRRFLDLSEETAAVDTDDQLQSTDCLPLDNSSEAIKVEENAHQVALIAEDFEEKIRLSSSNNSSSGANTHSASSSGSSTGISVALADLHILNDLESQAKQIAFQLDRILLEFNGSLNGMTELTVDCSVAYTNSVKKTCDNVDSTIKSMYQLLAKSEELLHTLKTLPSLAKQIREIKRLLDLFESHMQKSHG